MEVPPPAIKEARRRAKEEGLIGTEVDFLVHLLLALPPQLATKMSCSCRPPFLLPCCPVPWEWAGQQGQWLDMGYLGREK